MQDFLTRSPLELMNILNFSYSQLQSLTTAVCTQVAPTSQTVCHSCLCSSHAESSQGLLT